MLSNCGRSRLKMSMNMNIKMNLLDHKLFTTSASLSTLKLPSPKETHLWYVIPNEVQSDPLLREYLDLLSPSEKEHVFSFGREDLRKSALLARALVRTTIARYQINFQVNPRSLKFKKNTHGKPEVLVKGRDGFHKPPLHFNLSHTSSLIACGVTALSPIGIDVEEKQRRTKNNILSFARRFFSHKEVEFLTTISDPEAQRQEFVKLWTLKESYVKALGRGFSAAPFNTFDIRYKTATRGNFHSYENSISELPEIVIEPLETLTTLTTNWQFALIELASSHYTAICRENNCSSDEGKGKDPMKLTVWKTIPLAEDVCVSGTDLVVPVAGFA